MLYTSTRNNTLRVEASEAITRGISEDGGLFVPVEIPQLSLQDLQEMIPMSYIERAKRSSPVPHGLHAGGSTTASAAQRALTPTKWPRHAGRQGRSPRTCSAGPPAPERTWRSSCCLFLTTASKGGSHKQIVILSPRPVTPASVGWASKTPAPASSSSIGMT